MRPINSDVIAAITARKVMYWNTRRKPYSGPSDCSQLARLSSIGCSSRWLFLSCALGDRLDHTFHLHEARTLDEDTGGRVEFGDDGRIERIDVREMRALHRDRLAAQSEDLLDPALARVLADFGVELRALRAHLAHVAEP